MGGFSGTGLIGGGVRAQEAAVRAAVLGQSFPISGDSIVRFALYFAFERAFADGVQTNPLEPTDNGLFVDTRVVPDGRFWLVQAAGVISTTQIVALYMMPPGSKKDFPFTANNTAHDHSRGRGVPLFDEMQVNSQIPHPKGVNRPFVLPAGWFLRAVAEAATPIGGAINIEVLVSYAELQNNVICE